MTGPASVVIPCHRSDRFAQLATAVAAVAAQRPAPAEVIVVVDHNPALYRRASAELAGVTVLANAYPPGVSGTRNTGVRHAGTDLVALLDDDARPHPGWLAGLLAPFAQAEVVGTGGAIEPVWARPRPAWFPPEFLWAVGGAPATGGAAATRAVTATRNVWSASMAVRRAVFLAVGGFRVGFGKVGDTPAPEDTELCLRMSRYGGGQWRRVDAAVVDHPVPAVRTAFGFFLRRCYQEGRGKVRMARLVGWAGLAAERAYLTRTVPRALARGLSDAVRGRSAAALAQCAAALAGLAVAGLGGAVESVRPARAVAA